MRDIPTQEDGVTSLSADFFNEIPTELENAITTSGQTLTPSDGSNPNLNQLAIAMAIYGSGSDFYTASGTNTLTLAVIGTKRAPNSYFDGMRIRFLKSSANTGAVTVNVAGLGSVDLRQINNSQLASGMIQGYVEATYVNSLGYFVVISSTGGSLGGLTQTLADARYLLESNNLSDLDSASDARSNLGLVQTRGTPTRAPSTTYTNTDDVPRELVIRVLQSGGLITGVLSVNGALLHGISASGLTGSASQTITAKILPNETYSLTITAGSLSVWQEIV